MVPEKRTDIMNALNKAIEVFKRELDWEIDPVFKFEVRELRSGDWSLGESITIDTIKEFYKAKQLNI